MEPAPSPKPRQKPKILTAHRYIFSVNALAYGGRTKKHLEKIVERASGLFGQFHFIDGCRLSHFFMRRVLVGHHPSRGKADFLLIPLRHGLGVVCDPGHLFFPLDLVRAKL